MSIQGTESKKKDIPAKQEIKNEIKTDLELVVEPAVFEQKDTVKSCLYVLNNNLEQELIIPSYYTIEKLVDDQWIRVSLNETLAFEDITYAIEPKKSKEFPLALSHILKDNATEKGRYRLNKEAWLYGQDGNKKHLTAEFEIK